VFQPCSSRILLKIYAKCPDRGVELLRQRVQAAPGHGPAGRVCLGDNRTDRKIDQDDEVVARRKPVRPASRIGAASTPALDWDRR
jgi:hypothetical protein